jgi:hypothetical protein
LFAVLALLAGVGLAVGSTSPGVPTARALLSAAFGAAALGLATTARGDAEARTALGTVAVGLFAAAAGFGLSGATITAVWAVLLAVSAALAARDLDRLWLLACAGLSVAILFRIVAFDGPATEDPVRLFHATRAGQGVLQAVPWLNPLAFGLLAGAALTRGQTQDFGFLFLVFDPSLLIPKDDWQGQIDDLIANVKATPSLTDTAEIRIPSERAYAERAQRLVEGITVPSMIVKRIEELDRR